MGVRAHVETVGMSLPPSFPNSCRFEAYLARNADEIEHYIIQGYSFYQSLELLHRTNGRPTCIVCGGTIKRAKRESTFCRQSTECRRYARRYVYLYQSKGLTKTEALAIVFTELT